MAFVTIKITSIRQVHNKYLSLAFTIRENEIRRRNGVPASIIEYIHATGATKVASILGVNLDWRLTIRSKYGKGISFSPDAWYANKYCNTTNGRYRAFILCDVLVGQKQYVDNNNDTHPPKNIDSYESSTGYVLVKFDDFTFNPKFVVYYEEGGYDINSHLYYDLYFRLHDYNNSSKSKLEKKRNQKQRVLLKQILRIPLRNEDSLNAIIATDPNNRTTQTNKLPNQSPVMPKVNQSERSKASNKLYSREEKLTLLLAQHTESIGREEAGSRNGVHSRDRLMEPTTTPPNLKREEYCSIFTRIGIFYDFLFRHTNFDSTN